MSFGSLIGWCDMTLNPFIGCDRASEGCDNCYAIVQAWIRQHNPHPAIAEAFAGTVTRGEDGQGPMAWTGKVNLVPERLLEPFNHRKRLKIFINSLSDLFHEGVPDEYVAKVLAMAGCAWWHVFQVATKRHGRMKAMMTSPEFRVLYEAEWKALNARLRQDARKWVRDAAAAQDRAPWPIPGLWLGVSAETQKWAEIRIHALLACAGQAGELWVSLEPLLGPIDVCNLRIRGNAYIDALRGDVKAGPGAAEVYAACPGSLSWVVTGGESGTRARAAHPDWFRAIRDQADAAGVAFFFKQWGVWAEAPWRVDRDPGESDEAYIARAEAVCATHSLPAWSADYDMTPVEVSHRPWSLERQHPPLPAGQAGLRRVPGKAAGNTLDGRQWEQFPRIHLPAA